MNKKNAVVVIDIKQKGIHNLLQYTLKSFEEYCKRTRSELIILSSKKLDQKYNLHKQAPYPYIRFEKNQIYDLFDEYNRILRLDSDTLITENCPNYFLLDSNNFYVTREDIGSRKEPRLKQIQTIQSQLGIIPGWSSFYFNSGVILASRIHKEAFNLANIDLTKVKGGLQEQTVLNWLTFNLKLSVVDLGPYFNFIKFFEDENFGIRENSNIIHYAGRINDEKVKELKKDIINFKLSPIEKVI